MTLLFDPIPVPESSLSRLDPRWRLAGLVLAAGVAAVLQTVPAATAALVGALILACLARLPFVWYLRRLAALAPFLALCVLLLPFLSHDAEPLAHLGPLALSWTGLRLALLLCVKALTIVTIILVLLATAPLPTTLHAAHRLRVPGILVQLTLLTYRYLHLLAEEVGRVRLALRLRGYRNRATLHSYRTVAHVAGTLLVRSQERAERVGQALRCRGFDGHFRSLAEFQTRIADIVVFLVLSIVTAGLWMWDMVAR